MIQQLSCRVSNYLVAHGADDTQKEVYSYSIECLLNFTLSIFLLFSAGFFLHRLPEIGIWCISYLMLRIQIGGYHASTHARCIVSGTLVGICSLPLNRLWTLSPFIGMILFLLILLDIAWFAPVLHPHHPVSAKGRKKAKLRAVIITFLGYIIMLILQHFHYTICNAILSGFACALLLAFIGSIYNAKKGVSHGN